MMAKPKTKEKAAAAKKETQSALAMLMSASAARSQESTLRPLGVPSGEPVAVGQTVISQHRPLSAVPDVHEVEQPVEEPVEEPTGEKTDVSAGAPVEAPDAAAAGEGVSQTTAATETVEDPQGEVEEPITAPVTEDAAGEAIGESGDETAAVAAAQPVTSKPPVATSKPAATKATPKATAKTTGKAAPTSARKAADAKAAPARRAAGEGLDFPALIQRLSGLEGRLEASGEPVRKITVDLPVDLNTALMRWELDAFKQTGKRIYRERLFDMALDALPEDVEAVVEMGRALPDSIRFADGEALGTRVRESVAVRVKSVRPAMRLTRIKDVSMRHVYAAAVMAFLEPYGLRLPEGDEAVS